MLFEKARESSGENDFKYNFKVENYTVPRYGKKMLKMM